MRKCKINLFSDARVSYRINLKDLTQNVTQFYFAG